MITRADLTSALKDEARRQGFDLAGACAAVSPPRLEQFRQWLSAGYAGQMRYLADHAEAYAHPRHVLDGVQSILMLATGYRTVAPRAAGPGQGKISRYGWGGDYHDVIHDRLACLVDLHHRLVPQAAVRAVVDTAPLAEREFAELAGLGWIGKNTLLLNQRLGSWFFLAALLSSEPLVYDEPLDGGHCGTCRACLDACPTGALVAPYQLDARRCISYLTIELRETIPHDLRHGMGDWLFGCDVCQDVCPWNRRAPVSEEEAFEPLPEHNPVDLAAFFFLDDAAFRQRFWHTPLWRPRRRGLLRTAAILLGNRPHEPAMEGLIHGLGDGEPLVRAACAWALGRYETPAAADALRRRGTVETDAAVREEIAHALSHSP